MSIIFASGRDGPDRCEIYAIEPDGAGLRRLTNTPGDKTGSNFPAWSSDRSRIAFTSNREGKNQIYVANSDSSSPRRLTSQDAEAGAPSWSPEGDRLAFTSNLYRSWDICTVAVDGTELRRLTSGRVCWGARWSPDGERIAFFGPTDDTPEAPEEIFVTTSEGRGASGHHAKRYAGDLPGLVAGRQDSSVRLLPRGAMGHILDRSLSEPYLNPSELHDLLRELDKR